ncbi:amidase [Bordetella genomosp. 5]|uniref:Amidase n=1 Tax=Bordetella genomosp. 5 TaxID=1395608 RepID=A0A261TB11_9BORD|nr:amidase [Bordetella genomosp. 5]OZI40055.1 amidase [Bordetella genomosp. 5]OZI46818.1 amidase [Bordetella genomosp. 5]
MNTEARQGPRRPAPSDIARLTMAQGLRALDAGTLTCEAWARACLERIALRDAEVHAWVHVAQAAAIERARTVDRLGRTRPFDGVPLGIKDTIDTADMPTELGDPAIFPGRQPTVDAPVVARARALGFNLLGKNTVSRHAIMLPGPCRNPHDVSRTPAASSAGSGAAAADFMVPLSIGTQTAGSILRPASFCGAVGFKPTLDLIPYVGIRTYSRPLDVVGPLCRSVEDVQYFMRGFVGDPRYASPVPGGMPRLGVWRPRDWPQADAVAQRIFEENLRTLADAGAVLTELSMPASYEQIGDLQDVIMAYDLAREYDAIRRDHAEHCDPELLAYLDLGRTYSDADYARALDAADACRRQFHDIARDIDAIVMPATLGEAPTADSTGSSVFIRAWSLLHNPSISLPVARGDLGLPIAIQLVGFRHEDPALLAWARRVEAVLGSRAHDD